MLLDSKQWRRYLIAGAEKLGVALSCDQAAAMALHARELLAWNRRTNLTALTDPDLIAEMHYLDSIAPSLWIPDGATVLDVGSGGGFPGIPIKIIRPVLHITLADASRKKVTFMNHAIRVLNLEDIHARHVRVESITREDACCPRDGFSVIVSRALTSLAQFIAMSLPLLSDDGIIIVLKGKRHRAEAELSVLHQQLPPDVLDRLQTTRTTCYRLPYSGAERSIILLNKQK